VFCPDTDDAYLVPIEDVPTGHAYLRVEPTRDSQARKIRWARDYVLPRRTSDLDSVAPPE
jgi:hypothetical protein